ncbi:MAG TPA: CDP-alcohol phosphatidyltransferase family protein [Gemmatimonadaceae bacterium]|nr:CDP-alcohol phosphatidyltransferase family protein [Gemmatimonadaceae bacterium]
MPSTGGYAIIGWSRVYDRNAADIVSRGPVGEPQTEKAAAATREPVRLATRANAVAITRASLAFIVVGILYTSRELYLGAFFLTLVAIWMDGLDGWVARRFAEVSRIGAAIDILTDRIVEMTYWIAFATLGWIPIWVPIVVVVRGLLVDGARAAAFEQGFTAFGASSMMHSPLGRLLVSSRASRFAYGLAKAMAFSLMILAFTSALAPSIREMLLAVAIASVYVSVALCIIRGVPVLVEVRRIL